MTVLPSRPLESIMVGDEVVIKVLNIAGNQVRVGISAPAEIAVYREELYERLKREQGWTDRFDVR